MDTLDWLGWTWLAGLSGLSVMWLLLGGAQARFWWGTPRLGGVAPELPDGAAWPLVSVVVPSCNEAAAVEAATRSLVALDYPALEVVAVNDRSTDDTGAILERVAAEHPGRLTVVHVDTLPDGWLGKNHANDVGARRARGDWLLFTDGDVVFAPDALKRAIHFVTRCGLGHVAGMPHLVCPGFWERAAQTATFGMIATRFQMWTLTRARTAGFAGVGAFNLCRRDAYLAVGGHTPLRMEVADDMKLGMILRRSGVPQGCVDTQLLVQVRWQQGWWGSWRGLLKNGFAALNFSWPLVLGAVAALVGVTLAPLAALALAPWWWARVMAAWCVAVPMVLHGYTARRCAGGSGPEGLTQPLAALTMAATLVLSAVLTAWRGGVLWRGTLYPIGALKHGVVREAAWPTDNVVGWDPTRAGPSSGPGLRHGN
jgi:cellulose synthase/poly-beta-1,6-N-acetylglucosamine synthase-like glycosyltransferase